ncbi:MAG TPA: hypothetical protein VJW75_04600 [Candidatus Eisenbacteria bacterium]|nr:hypothetical protein [Candidatus Eisenbacteria bacterium]
MHSRSFALSLRTGVIVLALMVAGAARADVAAHFQPFAFLAGSCWSGTMSDGTTDTHCWEWVYGGFHLRDRHTVTGKGAPYYGETIYSWSPDKKRVVYRYWNSLGGYSDGDFKTEGASLVSAAERYVDAGGTQEFRTVLTRLDDKRYESRTEKREKGSWKPAWRVEFSKTAPDSVGSGHGSWSPDRADLILSSNREGNSEIYLRPGGTDQWVNLTKNPAPDNWPEWSPDGKRIAFQSRRTGNLDIWVMNADGTNQVQLTNDPEHDYLPAWSPDGASIVFTSWRREAGDTARANHIYSMRADGTGQRRLIPESPGSSAGASWSPDGSTLVLDRVAGNEGADVFLADANGKIVTRLTDDAAYDGSPVFSPDGSRIAFYSSAGEKSELVVIDRNGGNRKTLIAAGKNWYPRWSPDGRWLVYTAPARENDEKDLDVLAIPVDQPGKPIVLGGGPGRESEGRWRP